MSAGTFKKYLYEVASQLPGAYRRCVVEGQPGLDLATVGTQTNDQATAQVAAADRFSYLARARPGRNYGGVAARGVMVKWTAPPDGYVGSGRFFLPVFRKIRWDNMRRGDTVAVLGGTGVVVQKLAEHQNGQPSE